MKNNKPVFIALTPAGQYEAEHVRIDRIARISPNLSDKIRGESFVRWIDDSHPVIYRETPEEILRLIEDAS
jgi:hypothetical protein